jgi:hypothetical protein
MEYWSLTLYSDVVLKAMGSRACMAYGSNLVRNMAWTKQHPYFLANWFHESSADALSVTVGADHQRM